MAHSNLNRTQLRCCVAIVMGNTIFADYCARRDAYPLKPDAIGTG